MKRIFLLGTALALATSPAFATDVVNMDKVPHKVLFASAGSREVYTVGAGDTLHIPAQTSGFISLITGTPKPSQGTLHSDGMLSGVIGAERTEDIPADSWDEFAIWPDGTFGLQKHMRSGAFNH